MTFLDKLKTYLAGNQTRNPATTGIVTSSSQAPDKSARQMIHAYNTMPWFHAVLEKIAKNVSTVKWKLYVIKDKNGNTIKDRELAHADFMTRQFLIREFVKGELEEVKESPLLDLLHNGSGFLSGLQTLYVTQVHMDAVGEAFWTLSRNKRFGYPDNIWVIPPHRVLSIPTPEDPDFFKITDPKSTIRKIPKSEMIMFKIPNPEDPYGRGAGLGRVLGDELESDELSAKHIRQFFYGGGWPDLLVSVDNLNPEECRRLESIWNSRFSGAFNRFKAAFVNRPLDVTPLGHTFKDIQLVELRKYSRDMIIQFFGIPPEKFGILAQSNRSTISMADFFWTKDILLPRIDFLRNTIQRALVPEFDDNLILDFESPVIQDKEHVLNVMRTMPAAFTVNEWRSEASKQPLGDEGEKVILRPGEMFVDQDGTMENPQNSQNPQDPNTDQEEDSIDLEKLYVSIGQILSEMDKK